MKVLKFVIYNMAFCFNLILWLLVRMIPIRTSNRKNIVLIIPPDPWAVWGSRGDEAMLEVIIDEYGKRMPDTNFYLFVSNCITKIDDTYMECKYVPNWTSKTPVIGLWKTLRKLRPNEVVIVGADCMDVYYSKMESLVRLVCADLCVRKSIPYNIIGGL